jgi:preprotein translocase subunit YajC
MNSFYPAATIALSEICLALLVLSAILIFTAMRKQRQTRHALALLTEKLKQGEGERLIFIKAMLKDVYHVPDDKIDEISSAIIKTEMLCYRGLMDTFSSRNGATLENIDQLMMPVFDAYRGLAQQGSPSVQGGEPSIDGGGELGSLKSHLEKLKTKNEKLSQEMTALKTEMEETNEEFTRAFAGRIKDESDMTPPETATGAAQANPQDMPAASEENTTTVPAAEEDNTILQDDSGSAADKADTNEEDILKNLDIDLTDINLADEDNSENIAAAPSETTNETNDNAAKAGGGDNIAGDDAPAQADVASSAKQAQQDDVQVSAKAKTA